MIWNQRNTLDMNPILGMTMQVSAPSCPSETEIPFGAFALARYNLAFAITIALASSCLAFRPNGMEVGWSSKRPEPMCGLFRNSRRQRLTDNGNAEHIGMPTSIPFGHQTFTKGINACGAEVLTEEPLIYWPNGISYPQGQGVANNASQ